MNKDRILQSVKGSLIADAYALGSHWIYDEKQLASLPIDWNDLNPPHAIWHKGKRKGDFTHYGDQTLWLYECVTQHQSFSLPTYRNYWLEKMKIYTGYIDGSSRETLALLEKDSSVLQGSSSHDLSIIGRIAPLLLVSSTKEEFLKNTDDFVSFTHNSSMVREAAQFFGTVLFDVVEGKSISDALVSSKIPGLLSQRYEQALESKGKDSFSTIRAFGPACSVEGGFEGVVYLISSYEDYREVMIANAKAGGDNAARGMIVGMLLGAQGAKIPLSWEKSLTNLPAF